MYNIELINGNITQKIIRNRDSKKVKRTKC